MDTIYYRATAWSELHHYEVSDEDIRYKIGGSSIHYNFKSTDIKSVRLKKLTHRFFRAGFIGLAYPLVTLIPIYLKSGELFEHLSPFMLFITLAFPAAGLFFILKYRRIYRILWVTTFAGDELGIFEDDQQREKFDEIRARLSDWAAANQNRV